MANKYISSFYTQAAYDTANVGTPNVSLIIENGRLYYNGEYQETGRPFYDALPLTFKTLESGTFKLNSYDSAASINYSLDGGMTWATLNRNTNSPTVESGATIMWMGNLNPYQNYGVGYFSSTGRFEVYGNLMSIAKGNTFLTNMVLAIGHFQTLFNGCTGLTSAENLVLPATTLSSNSYSSMFQGCANLTKAPSVLPATTLEMRCYMQMFSGCTSLTTAPSLNATTLASQCYLSMFKGCTSLNNITCLATDGVSDSSIGNTGKWLDGVAASGTFTKAASMTGWPSGVNGIPDGWTVVDA